MKKVFVLACAFAIRLVKHRKMKRLQAQHPMAKAEQGETEQEIPFGLRAIEQGFEVEGVWNSNATTPLHSPAASLLNSSSSRSMNKLTRPKRDLSISSISVLDIPQSAHVKSNPAHASGPPPSKLESVECAESPQSTSMIAQIKTSDGQVETEDFSSSRSIGRAKTPLTITYSRPRTLWERHSNTAGMQCFLVIFHFSTSENC